VSDNPFTTVGNLTANPEVRTTSGGGTVANFTVASSKRRFDRNTQQWVDGDTLFMRCSAWDSKNTQLASHIGSSLSNGMRVLVTGELTQRSYQTREGEKRTVIELRVQDIGTALSKTATTPTTTTEPAPTSDPFAQGDDEYADEF
jgi:single-strand DNA-binding protein